MVLRKCKVVQVCVRVKGLLTNGEGEKLLILEPKAIQSSEGPQEADSKK